jgi:hypothetical protein
VSAQPTLPGFDIVPSSQMPDEDEAPLVTAARHSSESNSHYTPAAIVERARLVLRTIDLDPATCEEANRVVRAAAIYTASDDGFTKPWGGAVFLNPPGGLSDNCQRPVLAKCRETGDCGLPIGHTHDGVESSQKKWWFKLAREFVADRVQAAIFVCFSVELLQSTQVETPDGIPIPLDFPICFPQRRVAYVKPGGDVGTQPPHASAIVVLGSREHEARFLEVFSDLGRVTLPSRRWESHTLFSRCAS